MTWPAIRTILDGAVVTAALAAVSILLSLPLGLLLALLREGRIPGSRLFSPLSSASSGRRRS